MVAVTVAAAMPVMAVTMAVVTIAVMSPEFSSRRCRAFRHRHTQNVADCLHVTPALTAVHRRGLTISQRHGEGTAIIVAALTAVFPGQQPDQLAQLFRVSRFNGHCHLP